jgi:hypothetical protein
MTVNLVVKKNFAGEIAVIPDVKIRRWTEEALAYAPADFWKMPSSISGKYHPEDEFREGGKVLHTKRAFVALMVLMNSRGYFTDVEKSRMMAAMLIHDVGYSYDIKRAHPLVVRPYYATMYGNDTVFMSRGDAIFRLVETHMGRWTPKPFEPPQDELADMVHLADYIVCMRGTRFSTIEDLTEDDISGLMGGPHE